MFKKALYVFASLFCISLLSSIAQSCCERKVCASISKIKLIPKDNSGSELIDYKDSVYAKSLLIYMDADTEEEWDKPTCHSGLQFPSLITTANATSCAYDLKGEKVVNFDIYADKKYDANHEAGTKLNDLFKIVDADQLYAGGRYSSSSVKLYLLSNPDDTGTYVFSVKMTLESGKILKAETDPIKLIK